MLKQYAQRGAYNTIFLGIGTVASRALAFAFLPFFLTHLSLSEFGIWDFYQTFFSVGLDIVSSAAIISLSRFYFLYSDDPLKQRQSVGNACIMVIGASLVSVAGLLLALLLFGDSMPLYARLTIINVASYSLFALVLAYTRIREWLWWYLVVTVGQSVLALGLSAVGLAYGYGVESLFYATIISTAIYIPVFAVLCKKYWLFSWQIAQQQIAVSMPLLLSNVLFAAFLNIDRVMIRYMIGYETLGAYSLLWRFGALYQFFCITLMNASPVVLFNAEKEQHGTYLVRHLLSYGILVITTAGLYAAVISYYVIGIWFPVEYHYLAQFIPIFFFPLIMLQLGRLFQSAFLLKNNTRLVPVISIIAAAIQVVALWIAAPYGLQGVCYANTAAFSVYALLCYAGGNYINTDHPLDGLYVVASVLLLASLYVFNISVMACVWPFALGGLVFFTYDRVH